MTIHRVTKRKPDSVGRILREEFIEAYGLTQEQLSEAIGVTRTLVNELVNDRRGITIDMAIMLGKVFKNSPQFWLNIYLDTQLWEAFQLQSRTRYINLFLASCMPEKMGS